MTKQLDPYEIQADAAEPKSVAEMSDRELLEEIVTNMRMVGAAVSQFQNVGPAGLIKMVMGR